MRGRLKRDAPLAPLVWFKSGGNAEMLYEPADRDEGRQHGPPLVLEQGRRKQDAEREGGAHHSLTVTFVRAPAALVVTCFHWARLPTVMSMTPLT